jgi:PAS domain S-box-containing protein
MRLSPFFSEFVPQDLAWVIVDEGAIISAHGAAAADLFGVEPAALMGSSFARLLRDSEALLSSLSLSAGTDSRKPFSLIVTCVDHSGRAWPARAFVFPRQPDDPGPRQFWIGLIELDVDNNVDAAHPAFTRLLDAYFQYVDQMLWIDRNGATEYIYMSPAYASIWGEPLELIRNDGGRWRDRIHEDDRERVLAAVQERRPRGLPLDLEYRVVRSDGSICWLWVKGYPLPNGVDGKDVYIGTATDITDRKMQEMELARLQSLKSIGTISADLAHNFNNILAIIELTASTMALSGNQTRISDKIRTISEAVRRGKEITGALLAISSRTQPDESLFDANDAVRELAPLIAATAGPHIQVDLDLCPEICKIRADKSGFGQALINLVTNSRDAMQGVGRLFVRSEITPRCDEVSSLAVRIIIEDTGPGMSEEVMQRATSTYFSTKAKGSGTGLGLAITSGFMVQSDGKLAIENRAEGGLRITLSFPSRNEDDRRQPETGPSDKALRVLVVDDESGILESIDEILSTHGYHVSTSRSFKSAVQIIINNPFDLVLSDMALGSGETGHDLGALVKAHCPTTAFAYMSGYPPSVSGIAGDIGFLPKPFSAENLLETVHLALRNRPTAN